MGQDSFSPARERNYESTSMHFPISENTNVSIFDLGIKSRFRDLMPPLSEEQRKELGDSISKDGVGIPLIGWFDGTDWWLADGHNRHNEWLKAHADNPSLPEPAVFELKAKTEEDVEFWIIFQHINRRNLTANQLSEFRGRIYNSTKQDKDENLSKGKIYPPKKTGKNEGKRTSQALAETFGVTEKTIRNDGEFSAGVATLPPEEQKAVRSGKSELTKAEVRAIGRGEITPEKPKAKADTNGHAKAEGPKLDPSKRPIPKDMEEVFAACKDFNRISEILSEAMRELKKFVPGSDQPRTPGWEHFRFQQFEAAIQSAKAELKFSKPFTTCVKGIHKGSDCPKCRGVGFLVRDTIGRLSDLDKAKLPEVR